MPPPPCPSPCPGGLGSIDAQIIGKADEFLRFPCVREITEGLRIIAAIMNEFASWLEGCPCHSQALLAGGSQRMEVRCVWKGRRGRELACGAAQPFFDRLRHPSSDELTAMLSLLPSDQRARWGVCVFRRPSIAQNSSTVKEPQLKKTSDCGSETSTKRGTDEWLEEREGGERQIIKAGERYRNIQKYTDRDRNRESER